MSFVRDRLADLTDPHRFDLSPQGPGAILDVGCGSAKIPGALGIDISSDVIEHVQDPSRVVEELHHRFPVAYEKYFAFRFPAMNPRRARGHQVRPAAARRLKPRAR